MSLEECVIEILGRNIVSGQLASCSFIQLGGDSLRALRLAAVAQKCFGVRLSVASLLGDMTLAQVFAESGVAGSMQPHPAAQSHMEGAIHGSDDRGFAGRASHMQKGMWLAEQVAEGSQYNLVFIAFLSWSPSEAEVGDAVVAVVSRHEGLRTVFRQDESGIRRMVVDGAPKPEVIECDHRGEEFDRFVREAAAKVGSQHLDVGAGPALRFVYVVGSGSGSGSRSALVIVAHHMLLDGWAAGLLLKEIFPDEGLASLGTTDSDPPIGIEELFRYQRNQEEGGEWRRQAKFWESRLAGVPTVLDLPFDYPRPRTQDPAGARLPVDIGVDVSAGITQVSAQLNITPFAFLLAAFGLTLGRWTGSRAFLVGIPMSGRGTPELERLVAVAGNLVPVRIDILDEEDRAGYLRRVQRSLALSIENGSLPFDELLSRLAVRRDGSCHPLVQVSFGMHDQLVPRQLTTRRGQVRIEEAHGGGSQFDLTLLIGETSPSFAGSLEYATGVWNAAQVEAFAADLAQAARELAADPAAPLEDARCIAPSRVPALQSINDTHRDFPVTSLDRLFLETARRTPDAPAVRAEAGTLTYAELAGAAARQARLLREAGVKPGDRVAVGTPRSTAEIVAVLGTIWAGASYVGIDLDQPALHTRRILDRAAPSAVLVDKARARALGKTGTPVVGTWTPEWTAFPEDELPYGGENPGRTAYVAFTSGSTGSPKGVSVPHRAVTRLVWRADYLRLGQGERMLRFSPLAFDASTLEIWGALLTGATLDIFPAGMPTPADLSAFIAERGVTVAWLTAGFFRLVAEFGADRLTGMRQLLTGGDIVPHEHAARLLARVPGLVITNGYGPTENTTFTTVHSVTSPEEITGPLPIGTPVPGTRVYVLDDRRRVVPPGAVGELYAGGVGLADGYLDDEEETKRCFGAFSPDVPERLYRTGDLVRMDTEGRLRFLGRADDQVKVRGYRIELSAVSGLLAAHPKVSDAVVIVVGEGSDDKRLLAACVPKPGADSGLSAAVLRDYLARELPSYMVPALWALVDRLPVTGNGKVDRAALAALAAPAEQAGTDSGPGAEGNDTRVRVEALFRETLGEEYAAGTDEDFFVAGGDSLRAVRMMSRVSQEFNVELRLREFLLSPTPEGLAQLIEGAEHGGGRDRGTETR